MKRAVLFLLTVTMFSCKNGNDLKSTSSDSTINKKAQGFEVKQLAGVFYDTLPCAGCPGIVTKLYLKPDNTFVMEQQYLDKGIVYDMGRWSSSDSLLQLRMPESTKEFKINSHAELRLLDASGHLLSDSVKRQLLRRNNVPFKPLQPVPAGGVFSAVNDTMNLHVCAMNRDYPVSLAPAALLMKTAYQRAVKQPGQPLYATVAGHFELRPALNDTSTQDFFVIEKFIRFSPDKKCQ